MSYHFCQYKKKAGASSQQADAGPLFVKLQNERYLSTYWWLAGKLSFRLHIWCDPLTLSMLAGRPVPRHCEGFPEEAYQINPRNDEDSA